MDNIVKLSEVKRRSEAGSAPNQQQMAEHIASLSFELNEMAGRATSPGSGAGTSPQP
jgi:hypothetical protein